MTEIHRVLLVDDDEDIRVIGQMALRDVGGLEVILAANGPEAVALAEAEQPDAIMLDVMMPGMDGVMTLRRLRQQPSTAQIPVVFMTAKVQRQEVSRYIELGAIGVIRKPFDPMRLADELREIAARAAELRGAQP